MRAGTMAVPVKPAAVAVITAGFRPTSRLAFRRPEPHLGRVGAAASSAPRGLRRSCSSSLQSSSSQPKKYAVLGAGFAGLSVVWHLLQQHPKESHLCIDIYDEVGVGGGASGISGGLLHPYSPKAKLLWMGAECWKESQKMIAIAEAAKETRKRETENHSDEIFVWRRGILRPATAMKNVDILRENAQNSLESCRIEHVDRDAAQNLIENLHLPFNSAVYMPEAMNVHPKRYLEALYLACQNLVKKISASGYERKELSIYNKSVERLSELSGEYNAVIICLGAKAVMLPELAGKLPLRTCRGVVASLQLLNDSSEEYKDESPSILADAWLAVQGARQLIVGSTWVWGSKNASSSVPTEEASSALDELLSKASVVYPCIRNWTFSEARAGLRAMPPLTSLGSVPLLGCVDNIIGKNSNCRYWLLGGLGSRGLLYHGWLGKLMAKAVVSGDEQMLPPHLTSWKK